MSDPDYHSPISPGLSWYEASCGVRPTYPSLGGSVRCDVAIVGGGYCGLSAALILAGAGTSVVLLEQHRLGDGASGRNGGQMGTGQRASGPELTKDLGLERARALWDLAENAKQNLLNLSRVHGIDMDYQPGQLTPMHRKRFEKEAMDEVEFVHHKFGYDKVEWLDQSKMAEALGSRHYFGGSRDSGTGHIHPMKLLIGLGQAASKAGAQIHENSRVTGIRKEGLFRIQTLSGQVEADKVLVATNGYHGDLLESLSRHVMPIQSFIGATVPLPQDTPVLPNREAVDDSRFVVRYFRKSKDNRLLFGGREAYGSASPKDIRKQIRRQISEIYPSLANVELTHAWGGNVAITMPRMPFVRESEPGLWLAGGFSGHGVMLSNETGRLIAESMIGKSDAIRVLKDLKIAPFPGGRVLRNPLKTLALTWYAMLDRL